MIEFISPNLLGNLKDLANPGMAKYATKQGVVAKLPDYNRSGSRLQNRGES